MAFAKKEYLKRISDKINPFGYAIERFVLDKRCFGNIMLTISNGLKKHTVITDRGDIYINDEVVKFKVVFNNRETFLQLNFTSDKIDLLLQCIGLLLEDEQ